MATCPTGFYFIKVTFPFIFHCCFFLQLFLEVLFVSNLCQIFHLSWLFQFIFSVSAGCFDLNKNFDRNLTFDIFVNSSQLQWFLESRKKKLMEWWDDCYFAKMLVILRWSWNAAGRQALIRPDLVFIRECTRRMQPCFQFGQMNLFLKIWF